MATTIDSVIDELIDTADFEEVSSVTKAKAFISAANRYFILSPQQQSDEGSSLTMNSQQIENLLKRARYYVEVNATGRSSTNVKFLSAAEGFRR